MSDYLPKLATIAEACEWLAGKTGEQWTMPRIVEAAVMPWIWLDYSPEAPPEIFGDRFEGFLAPFIFFNDCGRIAIDRHEALMTMTRTPDGRHIRFTPGLRFDLNDIRFKREDVMQLAAEIRSRAPASPVDTAANGAPEGQQRHQEREILRTLQELGYDPLQLPRRPAGKPTAKAEARANLPGMTRKVFDKAWERLRGFGDIANAD